MKRFSRARSVEPCSEHNKKPVCTKCFSLRLLVEQHSPDLLATTGSHLLPHGIACAMEPLLGSFGGSTPATLLQ